MKGVPQGVCSISSGLACAGGHLWHSRSHATSICGGEGTGLCRQADMCIAIQAALGKKTVTWHIQLHLTAQTTCSAGMAPAGRTVTNVSTKEEVFALSQCQNLTLKGQSVFFLSWDIHQDLELLTQPYAGDTYKMWKFLVLPFVGDLFELDVASLIDLASTLLNRVSHFLWKYFYFTIYLVT